jgi:hypothetical protein
MLRAVPLSIIRSSFTVHSALVYVCHTGLNTAFEQDQDGTAVPSWSCSKAVWQIPVPSVQWMNSWWWAGELSETCRVSWQNKFEKLVHLVGYIIKKQRTVLIIRHKKHWTFKHPSSRFAGTSVSEHGVIFKGLFHYVIPLLRHSYCTATLKINSVCSSETL